MCVGGRGVFNFMHYKGHVRQMQTELPTFPIHSHADTAINPFTASQDSLKIVQNSLRDQVSDSLRGGSWLTNSFWGPHEPS